MDAGGGRSGRRRERLKNKHAGGRVGGNAKGPNGEGVRVGREWGWGNGGRGMGMGWNG